MIEELPKDGNINWTITKEDGLIEIGINNSSWVCYPADQFNYEEAKLKLVELIINKFQLYDYELKKREYPKGSITILGNDKHPGINC